MSAHVPPRRLWLLLLGFCIWAVALVILYATHAIGCSFGWPTGTLRTGLVLIFFVHLAALGWLWYAEGRAGPDSSAGVTSSFLHGVIVWVSMAAFASVILTLGPSLLLKSCL